MSVLAIPENSQLLLVNPTLGYLNQLDDELAGQMLGQFERLSAAADQACVPRYFAVSQDIDKREAWLSMPCEKNKPRVFHFGHDRPVWSNTDLVRAMLQEDREQLFICGFWLDDVVAAAALEAQSLGFNTHVIVDLSLSFNPQTRQSSFDRFSQFGIVPIALQNLLYEWMVKTEDDGCRKDLETFWKEQKRIDRTPICDRLNGLD